MILSFKGYTMLNESFKSRIIGDLFRKGELNTGESNYMDHYNSKCIKILLNQVTDKDIIGIVDSEEEARKLVHDKLGDKLERRYGWRRVSIDNGEDSDWDIDDENPYTVNATANEPEKWIVRLKSGRYLILKLKKEDLLSKANDIRNKREASRYMAPNETQFMRRKKFVDANKNDVSEYWRFKKYIQGKGIWNEFVKGVRDTLNSWAKELMGDNSFEEEVDEDGKWHHDCYEVEFSIGDLKFLLCLDAQFDGEVDAGSEPQTYWSPGAEWWDLVGGELYVNSFGLVVCDTETDEELFDFTYKPEIDKAVDLCEFDNTQY